MSENAPKNGLLGWWKKVVFENYANFNGRARRAEYWYFALATVIILIPFYIIAIVGVANNSMLLTGLGVGVYSLVGLALFVPSLAVGVRRLHDIGKSGWMYLLVLIPLVNIIVLVWFFTDGNRFANEYGEDPKNPSGPAFDFENKA